MSIDFSALRQQASEFLDKAEAARENPEEAVVATPAEPVAPASTTPEGTDPSQVRVKGSEAATEKPVEAAQTKESTDTPAEAAMKALQIGDDDLVEVTVDGEARQLPWKEAKGKISGGMKFTQNSQKLAAERKAFEESQKAQSNEVAALKAERDQLRAFLTSPKVKEYADKHFGGQPAEPQAQPGKPDEIATIGDATSIAQRQFAEMQKSMEQRLQETERTIADKQAKLEFERQQAAHAVVIDSTIADIFSKNPILKAFPQSEDVLRFQVAQFNPKTEAEAVEAFHTVAAGIVEELGKFQKQTKTAQVVREAKQKLESKSIEPAGGSAPQTAPTNYKKADGSVDWNVVRKSAAAMLG